MLPQRAYGQWKHRRGYAVAPTVSIAGTVAHGQVLTATHDGDTVQWYAGAAAITGETGDTYTVDRADGGYFDGITCHATNVVGTTISNALTYTSVFRDIYDPALGKTLAGALVTAWEGQGAGNVASPLADMEPTYAASDAGFGGQPVVAFAGSDEWLRAAAYDMGAAVADLSFALVLRIDTAVTNDIWFSYGDGTNYLRVRQVAGPKVQVMVGGAGGTSFNSTATLAAGTVYRIVVTADLNGTVNLHVDSTAVDSTVSVSHADLADDGILSIGASNAGAATAAITIGFAGAVPAILTSAQIADFLVYTTERFS